MNNVDFSERAAKVKVAYDSLKSKPKSEIVVIYKQAHKVSSVSGASKEQLIIDILIAQYGRKAVSIAFNW